jgi:hypothetical protein
MIGDAVEDFVPYFREQFDHVGERGKGEASSKTEEALSGKWAVAERDDRRSNFNQSIPSNLGYPAADATYYTAMMLESHGIY